jgi:hypothetical protein
MRNISFQFTKAQILARTKTVTRRMGWDNLKDGERLQGVEKGMGLKKGEKIKNLVVIEVVSTRRERLDSLTRRPEYGKKEVKAEGFPDMTPAKFVEFFCASHKGCKPKSKVNRIEFRYID